MIFVVGDTHGGQNRDLEKLNNKHFKNYYKKGIYFKFKIEKFNNRLQTNFNNRKMKFYKDGSCDVFFSKEDKVIVLGDFGLIWSYPNEKYYKEEQFYLKQFSQKPYQLLFLDGNHDNHNLLENLEIKDYCGGKVGIAYKDKYGEILYLKRGEVYIFDNKKYLIFGGATTHSYLEEIDGQNWWSKENIQFKDIKNCLKNLKKHNFKVDYVLTHTCPQSIGLELYKILEKNFSNKKKNERELEIFNKNLNRCLFKANDRHAIFFENLLKKYNLKFKEWHFGHYHEDQQINKYFVHYNNFYELKN